jgi:hypothetical protein
VNVCNRLTLDHDVCVGGERVTRNWGHGIDISIGEKGEFGYLSQVFSKGLDYVRVMLYLNPNGTQMKYIRSEIQTALLAQGLFKIEVEEIIPEADYTSHPAFTQSDDDDENNEYDDDEPF